MHANITGSTQRLRIYIGESHHYHHKPLYHAIVIKARELGMAGATVTRAMEGFGASSRIHSSNLLDLSADLPIIVEIIDSQEYIKKFLPELRDMVQAGLITVEDVNVMHYGHDASDRSSG